MPSLGTEVNIDMSTSCTKDQAVMKLLGWSKDIFTSTQIHLPQDGLWLDQLSSVSHHTLNLEEELKQLHERARLEYQQAFPPEAGTAEFDAEKHFGAPGVLEKLTEKQETLEDVKALIRRARNYAMDIDEALSKGDSELCKDLDTTERTGVLHITLRSLERWQKDFYAVKPDTAADSMAQISAFGDPDLMAQLSRAIPENRKDIGQADLSLYITLGMAVEAIAEKLGSPYGGKGEAPVISQIAELIAGKYQSKDGTSVIRGQGLEMIRKRLSLAMKVKPNLPKVP